MKRNNLKIFISYSQKDIEFFYKIKNSLNNFDNFEILSDLKLFPGKNIFLEIKKLIFECDIFIMIISRNSLAHNNFTNYELEIAIDYQKKIYIISTDETPISNEYFKNYVRNLNVSLFYKIYNYYNEGDVNEFYSDLLNENYIYSNKFINSNEIINSLPGSDRFYEHKFKEVKNVNDFIKNLFEYHMEAKYIFRGISKKEDYYPKLYRKFLVNGSLPEIDSKQLNKYETELLKKFTKYSIQYLPSNINFLDWVASAQHYGIPTRLLDWTFDPFCGLYFSVYFNDKPDDDFYYLFVLNKDKHIYEDTIPTIEKFNLDATIYEYRFLDSYIDFIEIISGKSELINLHNLKEYPFVEKIEEDLNKKRIDQRLFFCSPNDSNPRIVAQNGLFQIPKLFDVEKDQESIAEDIKNGCETIYKIHKDLQEDIIIELEKLKMNSIRLFPDLSNICSYINKSVKP